jgi:hypothetical protein
MDVPGGVVSADKASTTLLGSGPASSLLPLASCAKAGQCRIRHEANTKASV